MSEIPDVAEKYTGAIEDVPIGKGDYIAGGIKGMPFLSFENPVKRRPMIAGEIFDCLEGYPQLAADMFDGRQNDPVEWADMWRSMGADIICIRFAGLDPSKGNTTPESATELVKKISDITQLPIMICGCGIPEYDIPAFTKICETVTDTRLILSKVDEDEYKKMASIAIANNHIVLGFSNLDVNLAKQMNILLTDFGVKKNDIVMDPLMSPLGMGLDYSYSVNERIRMAALMGDKMLQIPMVCDCTESWNVGDAICDDDPTIGDVKLRVTWWEAITALCAVLSGADIIIMRGPGAADMLKGYCDELRGEI
ncbi:MAG: acetyl-CoA decarbonylase/synthase complex subunit delta [Thermoplasmata archaeon]|nr:acetyl-CoA decarbonylase/synthase complex subunit delta [Thermoplasmata archaeon]